MSGWSLRQQERRFERVFAEQKNRVYGLCLRMLGNEEDACDAVQETFTRVYKGLDKFRGDSSVSTWVHAIAANVCRTALERRRYRPVSVELEDDPIDTRPSFEAAVEARNVLEKALGSLSDELRLCLLLAHVQGFSYEEIARALSIPVGTVKSRVFRASKQLAGLLEGQETIAAGTNPGEEGSE